MRSRKRNQKKMNDKILRLLFKFESEYSGDSSCVSGNSLRHGLHQQVDTSMGIFTDIPELVYPSNYHHFFLIRTRKCFLKPYFDIAYNNRKRKRYLRCFFLPEYVTFDIKTNDPENIIEKIEQQELIQLGGHKNLGFGVVKLMDHLVIDVKDIELPERASHLTLISPWMYVEKFVHRYECRKETQVIWNNRKQNVLHVISKGQFFRIKRKNIQSIARKGLFRRHLLHQFGYGEFILNDWTNDKEGDAE